MRKTKLTVKCKQAFHGQETRHTSYLYRRTTPTILWESDRLFVCYGHLFCYWTGRYKRFLILTNCKHTVSSYVTLVSRDLAFSPCDTFHVVDRIIIYYSLLCKPDLLSLTFFCNFISSYSKVYIIFIRIYYKQVKVRRL